MYRGGEPVSRSEILVTDLSRWHERTPEGRVSIDPLLGRIAFPTRHPPEEEISVTCAHLGMGAIGGGSYRARLQPRPRPSTPSARTDTTASGVLWRRGEKPTSRAERRPR